MVILKVKKKTQKSNEKRNNLMSIVQKFHRIYLHWKEDRQTEEIGANYKQRIREKENHWTV